MQRIKQENISQAPYNPKTDGDLEKYFEKHDGLSCFPLFKGSSQFRMLWGQGYINPDMTSIMIMWNSERDNENFSVVDQSTLQGIYGQHSSGRPGQHDISILDKTPPYVIHYPLTKRFKETLERNKHNRQLNTKF